MRWSGREITGRQRRSSSARRPMRHKTAGVLSRRSVMRSGMSSSSARARKPEDVGVLDRPSQRLLSSQALADRDRHPHHKPCDHHHGDQGDPHQRRHLHLAPEAIEDPDDAKDIGGVQPAMQIAARLSHAEQSGADYTGRAADTSASAPRHTALGAGDGCDALMLSTYDDMRPSHCQPPARPADSHRRRQCGLGAALAGTRLWCRLSPIHRRGTGVSEEAREGGHLLLGPAAPRVDRPTDHGARSARAVPVHHRAIMWSPPADRT